MEKMEIFRFQNSYLGYHLTLDHRNKRLYTHAYKSSNKSNDIISMDYDGNDRKKIMKYLSADSTSSLDVIGSFLHWNSGNLPSIIKVNVSKEDIFRYIPLPKGFMVKKLFVVDKKRQPEGRFILLWLMILQIVV